MDLQVKWSKIIIFTFKLCGILIMHNRQNLFLIGMKSFSVNELVVFEKGQKKKEANYALTMFIIN